MESICRFPSTTVLKTNLKNRLGLKKENIHLPTIHFPVRDSRDSGGF